MKAVLDANVLVSSAISAQGSPALVLDAWRDGRFILLISKAILAEARDVLSRPYIRSRHRWTQDQIDLFVNILEEQAVLTSGAGGVAPLAEDPSDTMYLACALEGEADYVVSGDQHLLRLGVYAGIPILSPAQFMRVLENSL